MEEEFILDAEPTGLADGLGMRCWEKNNQE